LIAASGTCDKSVLVWSAIIGTWIVAADAPIISRKSDETSSKLMNGIALMLITLLEKTGFYRKAVFYFRYMVVVCRHCLFSWAAAIKNSPGGLKLMKGGPISPVSVPILPKRGVLQRKRSGGSFFRSWSVNLGQVYGCPTYFRGTYTLIWKSA
jgi:hypothetical protein